MELWQRSASDLARMIAARDVAPSEVVAAHLARIAQVNAVVSLRDRDAVVAEARALDDAPRRGWMHGLPVSVKDLANVAGMPTSFGSPCSRGWWPRRTT